jgi:L-fucose mutarotase
LRLPRVVVSDPGLSSYESRQLMLIGISAQLPPDLLYAMASMGHGDELVIADANFPAAKLARRLVQTTSESTTRLAMAVLTLLPIDEFVPAPLALMQAARVQDRNASALADLSAGLSSFGKIEQVERNAFYERAAQAFAIVTTADARPYANLILRKGVVAQDGLGYVG